MTPTVTRFKGTGTVGRSVTACGFDGGDQEINVSYVPYGKKRPGNCTAILQAPCPASYTE